MSGKLIIAEGSGPAERPHRHYVDDLESRIMALEPATILDVGCGEGALLRSMKLRGVGQCIGIEIDGESVAALRKSGLDVRLGRAERLDFPDRGVDVVVFQYVAHHIEYLDRALSEALRVARRAVVVLDPWYDLSIASQSVACEYDLWLKQLDRKSGMIHNPVLTAAQLAAPFRGTEGWQLDFRYRLILTPMSPVLIEKQARERLTATGSSRQAEDRLEVILDNAREHGFSDDGAILLVATRPGD